MINQAKITGVDNNILTNAPAVKYGVSGTLTGTVYTASVALNVGNVNYTALFMLTQGSWDGDSGEPVGAFASSSNAEPCVHITGITIGAQGGYGGKVIACKMSNITSQLGVSVVYGDPYPY